MTTDFNSFFKSAITVDNVIFGFDGQDLKVLLIKRGEIPYMDNWALAGHFVKPAEDLDKAAERILEELTGLKEVYLEQVHTFGQVQRHPMGRVITVAYYSLININNYEIRPQFIAQKATWHRVSDVINQALPFDHNQILIACMERLKLRVKRQPIGFELLPAKFTLTQLKQLYDSILLYDSTDPDRALDKRNFRKKILSMKILVDLEESQEGVAHRPAKLYQFEMERYNRLIQEGLHFDISYPNKPKNKTQDKY